MNPSFLTKDWMGVKEEDDDGPGRQVILMLNKGFLGLVEMRKGHVWYELDKIILRVYRGHAQRAFCPGAPMATEVEPWVVNPRICGLRAID